MRDRQFFIQLLMDVKRSGRAVATLSTTGQRRNDSLLFMFFSEATGEKEKWTKISDRKVHEKKKEKKECVLQ